MRKLDTIEPTREAAMRFNVNDLAGLQRLYSEPTGANDIERERAKARALHILSQLLPIEEIVPLIDEASQSQLKSVRRTAAVAAGRLPEVEATRIFTHLMEDPDASVQRATARAIPLTLRKSMRPSLERARGRTGKDYSRELFAHILMSTPPDNQ